MKLIKKISKIMVLFFVAGILLNSCQKQELQPITNQNDQVKDPILEKILTFKNKVENYKNVKTDETMSLDSAVWYVEAALNYSYCLFNEPITFENSNIDSIKYSISNNNIEISEVLSIYLDLSSKIEEINNKNKVFVVDIFFDQNQIISYIYYTNKNSKSDAKTFNGFTQPCIYTQADELIENAVNNTLAWSRPYGYFTDIQTIYEIIPYWAPYLQNPNSDDFNFCYYYIFGEGSGDYDPNGTWSEILTVEEMNFYYNGAFTAGDLIKTQNNINIRKRLISINYQNGSFDSGNYTYYSIFHVGEFTYAKINSIITPIEN